MIVNADDFGLSPRVNEAIVRAFDEGLISSTTVMANMPAFAEASAIARDRGLLDHVGAHLVLTEGEPLTDTMRHCRRFCDADGRFTLSEVECLGSCGTAPMFQINFDYHENLTPDKIDQILGALP